MSTAKRRLIVNADDLGMHPEVDAGILEAHRDGIVTSASVMVRRPSAADGAKRAVAATSLSLGLHIDFSEWDYRDGRWQANYDRVDSQDTDAVRAELHAQLELFRDMVGRDPTHLDSHQHIHAHEPVRSVATELATTLGVPLRNRTPGITYRGDFYGQSNTGEPYPSAISRESLCRLLRDLPDGITELGCHPGRAIDLGVSSYAKERSTELDTLSDPAILAAITSEEIELISFASLR